MSKFSRLYAVRTACLITPDHFLCAPNTTREYKKLIPMEYYILVHPAHGLMLIDTGMVYDSAPVSARSSLAAVDMPTIDHQLAEIGFKTSDVKHIMISHLHYDHISQVHFFPDAVFHVAKAEVDGIRAKDGVYPPVDKEILKLGKKPFPI